MQEKLSTHVVNGLTGETGLLSSSQFKHVFKTIRGLRDDIVAIYPRHKSPDSWTLKCLIASLYNQNLQHLHWDQQVVKLLQSLKTNTTKHYSGSCPFIDLNSHQPLFSTKLRAQFNRSDAYFFATLALAHFQKTRKV